MCSGLLNEGFCIFKRIHAFNQPPFGSPQRECYDQWHKIEVEIPWESGGSVWNPIRTNWLIRFVKMGV